MPCIISPSSLNVINGFFTQPTIVFNAADAVINFSPAKTIFHEDSGSFVGNVVSSYMCSLPIVIPAIDNSRLSELEELDSALFPFAEVEVIQQVLLNFSRRIYMGEDSGT